MRLILKLTCFEIYVQSFNYIQFVKIQLCEPLSSSHYDSYFTPFTLHEPDTDNCTGKGSSCGDIKWQAGINILTEISLTRHFQLQHEDSQTTITAHILEPVSRANEMSHTCVRRRRHAQRITWNIPPFSNPDLGGGGVKPASSVTEREAGFTLDRSPVHHLYT